MNIKISTATSLRKGKRSDRPKGLYLRLANSHKGESRRGVLSEWSNVSLSKSDEVKASGGSNPPHSAKRNRILIYGSFIFVSKVLQVLLFLHKKFNQNNHFIIYILIETKMKIGLNNVKNI